ncbi:MAG TPA: hypothetical protein VMX57_05145, partial [Planctomycetota bacterium]|nr:hypothetical protein [Planctomycetota bacterium]
MMRTVTVCLLVAGLASLACAQEGRTKVRMLYDFENPEQIPELKSQTDNMEVIASQDYASGGRNSARLVVPKGGGYGGLVLRTGVIRDWADFDYLAMDVYTDDAHPYGVMLEVWDALSKDYATRCTWGQTTHKGRQMLLFKINRAKRNNKEGRDWDELEPQDKIRMNALTMVKIFTVSLKDRDAVFFVDNMRLMQEDAAIPKMNVKLPPGALAFDFGSVSRTVGFTSVTPQTRFQGKFGFTTTNGLDKGGTGWPDALTGTFVHAPVGREVQFKAAVPDGEYLVWLAAGKIIRPDLESRRYLLKLNDVVLCDVEPEIEEFCGEDYLYRFMWTQYSEKPDALWTNYIDRMYPAFTQKVRATNGEITLTTVNHFLSALVLLPADRKDAFDGMTADV